MHHFIVNIYLQFTNFYMRMTSQTGQLLIPIENYLQRFIYWKQQTVRVVRLCELWVFNIAPLLTCRIKAHFLVMLALEGWDHYAVAKRLHAQGIRQEKESERGVIIPPCYHTTHKWLCVAHGASGPVKHSFIFSLSITFTPRWPSSHCHGCKSACGVKQSAGVHPEDLWAPQGRFSLALLVLP